MRISALATQVGVPTSTIRYYERIGLLTAPARTPSGYREYDEAALQAARFVARSRRLGLTCAQVAALLPAWDGATCTSAHARVSRLVEEKQAEVAARIEELTLFAGQLAEARALLAASPPPEVCCDDLSCCIPAPTGPVPIELVKP
jgi:MerR family copper efflux transcriptional regulator